MYALADITSAYAAAEKIYNPSIRNKPTLVLSNNDSTVVALCPIAKRLGFKKFVPFFQIEQAAKNAGAVIRSSNYALYQDVANRLFATLEQHCDQLYEYSIDEAFMKFNHQLNDKDWYQFGHEIRRIVWKEVRVPIGVGFGPTPTLAKAANHAAKKLKMSDGSATMNSYHERKSTLSIMAPGDVWGVGSRIAQKLESMGIKNAFQLSQQDPKKIRKLFNILLENTVRELNGEPRLSWDDVRPAKKEIYSTRSFGNRITCKAELKESLVKHAEIAAQKLRKQNSVAASMTLFASSSPHDNTPYTKRHSFVGFPVPTCDTRVMISAVSDAIHQIYIPGVKFYKSGLGLLDIRDSAYQQGDLFSQSKDSPELMKALDAINSRFGRETLQFAAKGSQVNTAMKRQFLSPSSTTKWSEIPKIKC